MKQIEQFFFSQLTLPEGLLVDGVDLAGDSVVVVGELPDELLLGVCHCKHGHGQKGEKGGAVHFGALLVLSSRLGCCKWEE